MKLVAQCARCGAPAGENLLAHFDCEPQTEALARARAAEAGFAWCPEFPFHAHRWRLAAWWCRRRH